jgi:hypothetical protein
MLAGAASFFRFLSVAAWIAATLCFAVPPAAQARDLASMNADEIKVLQQLSLGA